MRSRVSILVCLASLAIAAQTASTSPDALLQRGIASYRAAHHAEAAKDLKSAADALLSNEQMQTYVASGKFPNIEQFETALVYLTLAEEKLGHREQAKESVLRLITAERIENVFAKLPLDADAAEFPSVAARLVPGTKLPANAQLASAGATTPAPVQTAQTIPTIAPPPATTTTPAAADREREERERAIADAVAAERARMQKESDERVAQARREAQAEARQQAQAAVVQQAPPPRTDYLVRLRQADAYADNGQLSRANDMYVAIANAADAPRDVVAEAAVGLYRTSDFRDAITVLRKLAPFARGEEDLRYYDAVSLYETGDYAGAKRELACALPFIQANEDVDRYRSKIERTAASMR